MKKSLLIIFGLIWVLILNAQTPYDSFAPESTRPMMEVEALHQNVERQNNRTNIDTIPCVAVIDLQRKVLMLVDLRDNTILGATPLTDELQKWLSVDPLVDKNISTSPYMYCNGNPIVLIDPDGNSPKDKVMGVVIGVVTNVIPLASSTSLRDAYHPDNFFDYNTSLQAVDNLSQVAGPVLTASGFSDMLQGRALAMEGVAVAATGVGAPAGGLAVAMGDALAGTGILKVAAGTTLTANATNNKANGYSRGEQSSTPPQSVRKMNDKEVKQLFKGNDKWHSDGSKTSIINNYKHLLKGQRNPDFYIDNKTKEIYLRGRDDSTVWVKTNLVLE